MTGWRLGFAHGPRRLIEEMIKLQQFSFVCAPSMVQHAGVAALDYDVSGIRRRLPPKARPHLRRHQGPLRTGEAGRGVLPVSQGAARHGHGVRRRGHPQSVAVHPRRGVQPPGHAFSPELRRRRTHAGSRHRNPQPAGAGLIRLIPFVSAARFIPAGRRLFLTVVRFNKVLLTPILSLSISPPISRIFAYDLSRPARDAAGCGGCPPSGADRCFLSQEACVMPFLTSLCLVLRSPVRDGALSGRSVQPTLELLEDRLPPGDMLAVRVFFVGPPGRFPIGLRRVLFLVFPANDSLGVPDWTHFNLTTSRQSTLAGLSHSVSSPLPQAPKVLPATAPHCPISGANGPKNPNGGGSAPVGPNPLSEAAAMPSSGGIDNAFALSTAFGSANTTPAASAGTLTSSPNGGDGGSGGGTAPRELGR